MAQFFTDFSEYTTSAQPSDWTEYWNTGGVFTVRADGGYTGGKYLEVTEMAAFNRTGLSWDDVADLHADEELLVRFNTGTAGILLLALRANGTAESARTGYVALLRNDTNALDIKRASAGVELSLGTTAFTFDNSTMYWARFRVNGSDIKLKVWADSGSEPGTWNQEYTNSDITAAGRIQIGTTGNTGNNFLVDLAGIGTAGDSAPDTGTTVYQQTITANSCIKNQAQQTITANALISTGGWYNASWLKRVKITVLAAQVDADLTNYPVYVDLSDLPAEFHTNVNQTDARDIRVTLDDGTTEVPREVVFYDSATDTGELHFKANVDSDVNTDFYVYYDNVSATEPSVSSTYGRNNVWSDYKAVYHMHQAPNGTVVDSAGNTNLDANVNMDADDVITTGKIYKANKKEAGEYWRNATGISFSSGSDVTFQAWLYPTAYSGNAGIWRSGNTSTAQQFNILNGGTGRPWIRWDTATDILKPTSGYVIPLNEWTMTHWVVTSATNAKVYASGAEQHTANHTKVTPAFTINNLGWQFTTAEEVVGRYDEVRFRASILTATWISTEYNNQNSPSTFYSIGSEEQQGGTTYQKTASANASIRSPQRKTASANSDIKATQRKTASANSDIKNVLKQTVSANSRIFQPTYQHAVADSKLVIFGEWSDVWSVTITDVTTTQQSITANADIKQVFANTASANACIKQTHAQTTTANSLIENTYIATVLANANIISSSTSTITANSNILAVSTFAITADADIFVIQKQTISSDSDIKNTITQTVLSNADILNTFTQTLYADTRIENTYHNTITADSCIKQTFIRTISANSDIKNVQSHVIEANADIFTTLQQYVSTNTSVLNTSQQTILVDASLLNSFANNVSANASINVSTTNTAIANANVKTGGTQSVLLNADILQQYQHTSIANSDIQQTILQDISANAYITRVEQNNTIADANIIKQQLYHIVSDADVTQTYQNDINANVDILSTIQRTVIFDANIVKSIRQTAVASSYITRVEQHQISSDANISVTNTHNIVSDANISVTNTHTITADCGIVGGNQKILTADSSIRQTLQQYVSANAYITQIVEHTLAANTNIRAASLQYVISDSNVRGYNTQYILANSDVLNTVNNNILTNANILTSGTASILTNASIQTAATCAIEANADIFRQQYTNVTADASIKRSLYRDVVANTSIKATQNNVVIADADIRNTYQHYTRASANLVDTRHKVISADSTIATLSTQHIIANASLFEFHQQYVSAGIYIGVTTPSNLDVDHGTGLGKQINNVDIHGSDIPQFIQIEYITRPMIKRVYGQTTQNERIIVNQTYGIQKPYGGTAS